MPLYLIESTFAEQAGLAGLASRPEDLDVQAVLSGVENRWLFSFLSADKKKMYCLYVAPNPDTLLKFVRSAGLPADVIIPVEQLRPEAFA